MNTYMFNKWGDNINGTNSIVQLDNIANINDEKNTLQDKIIITLIKTEEEPTLKNGPFYKKNEADEVLKHHPAIYLNMYLLFSITKKSYKEALQLLSDTILFFQSQKVFEGSVSQSGGTASKFKILADLHDLPMQEVFELWSNLGNKQYPFILYKARVVKVMDEDKFTTTHLIKKSNVLSN